MLVIQLIGTSMRIQVVAPVRALTYAIGADAPHWFGPGQITVSKTSMTFHPALISAIEGLECIVSFTERNDGLGAYPISIEARKYIDADMKEGLYFEDRDIISAWISTHIREKYFRISTFLRPYVYSKCDEILKILRNANDVLSFSYELYAFNNEENLFPNRPTPDQFLKGGRHHTTTHIDLKVGPEQKWRPIA